MLRIIKIGDTLNCLACDRPLDVVGFLFIDDMQEREGIKCPKCGVVFDTHFYHMHGKCLSRRKIERGGKGVDIDAKKRIEGDLYDITIRFHGKKLKRKHRHKDELYLSEVRLQFLKKLDSWKIESADGMHMKIIPYKSIKYISASPIVTVPR